MILRFLYVVFCLAATLFALPKALAQNAVGLTLGGPTYIHFTHGLGGTAAMEAGVSFSYNHATHIYGDYLLQTHEPIRSTSLTNVGFFYGLGAMIVIMNDDHRRHHRDDGYYGDEDGELGFGARLPLGLNWRPPQTKDFSFHLQLVPIIAVVPETELEFNAGLGFKFHF